ncbi:MAG: hypothetical protein ABIR83_06195, partial [Nakamurella sp.]
TTQSMATLVSRDDANGTDQPRDAAYEPNRAAGISDPTGQVTPFSATPTPFSASRRRSQPADEGRQPAPHRRTTVDRTEVVRPAVHQLVHTELLVIAYEIEQRAWA